MSQEDKSSLTEENASKNRWTSSLCFIMAMGALQLEWEICAVSPQWWDNMAAALLCWYIWSVFFYLFYMAITVVIVIKGITKGIERACKIMLPFLFIFPCDLGDSFLHTSRSRGGDLLLPQPDFSKSPLRYACWPWDRCFSPFP